MKNFQQTPKQRRLAAASHKSQFKAARKPATVPEPNRFHDSRRKNLKNGEPASRLYRVQPWPVGGFFW